MASPAAWLHLVLLLAPIAADAAPDGPSGRSTAVIGVGADVDSFNEYVATSTLAYDLARLLYLTLMEEVPGRPGEPPAFSPLLARSWSLSPDGLRAVFELRDDVRWSDGRPTTAGDVVYTWKVQTDRGLAWPDAELKSNIADVTQDGPYRVVFHMRKPGPWTLLEINEGHILPRHVLEMIPPQKWRETDFSTLLVTNGPFRLASWKPGRAIELARNERYHETGLPGLDRVVFRVVTEPSVRLQQLLTGESDVLDPVAPEWIERLRADPDVMLVAFDQRMYTYLCWNVRRPLFADASVRRALTMALDRDEMLAVLAGGLGRPSAGPIVSSSWAASRRLSPLPFDPAASRRLLEEAGWRDADGDGVREKGGVVFGFDLEFNRGNTLRENLALRAAAQLAAVGVKATPRAVEWAAFQRKHREGDFDAFVASRIVPTRVSLESFMTGAGLNHSGWSDPRLDELAARAAGAPTLEQAAPLFEQAQEIIAREQPFTFLFEQDRLCAYRRRLGGVRAGPLGVLSGLKEWRVAAAPASGSSASD